MRLLVLVCLIARILSAETHCFDDSMLSAADREYARELLLKALDREALYTFAGGLKPLSIGFASLHVSTEGGADLAPATRLRRIMPAFACDGIWEAQLLHSGFVIDGERYINAVVYHRGHFAEVLRRRPELFESYGLTPEAHPVEVLMAVESARESQASLMLGHLLGYPPAAIDFFYAASREQARTGLFVRRTFRAPESFQKQNYFVWAVPLGSTDDSDTQAIMSCAADILREYKKRRDRFVGEGKPGPFALLRDWKKDGFPTCAAHAWTSGAAR
ncbi:MAG TPA: hypothetical protein VE621_18285 [Bryobacteraceae bacterium]|jgi:hypothetical protein|nr:hypothetical protein [Bryobacteraceae bacterium]